MTINSLHLSKVLIACGVLSLPTPALAYIGPGAGMGAIAVTLAIVIGVLLLLIGLVWYPLKRLMKGKNRSTPAQPKASAPE